MDEQNKESAVGAAEIKELLSEILEQQKKQTYLLAFRHFNHFGMAEDFVNEKHSRLELLKRD